MTNSSLLHESIVCSCFFARHPIFERDMNLWGYQLLYREDADADSAHFTDKDQATVQVILEAATSADLGMATCRNLLMEFSETALAHEAPYALPAQNTVIKIMPASCLDEKLGNIIDELRANGYRLAVDGDLDACRHLLGKADLLVVDALGGQPKFIESMTMAVKTGIPVLVKRIEDRATFELAKKMGADFFLGFFFQKPETFSSRKLSSMQMVRLKLLKMLDTHGDDWQEIARIMQNDVSLSYRLLKYLNSPHFGIVQPITTIERAISYLGWKQAKIWLRMVILTDLAPPEKTSQLPLLSAQRGKFLELLAQDRQDIHGDEFFLLGLFSLLDSIFDIQMCELVDYLPLTKDLKETLCGPSGPYAPWLDLAVQFEQGRWDHVDTLIHQLGLDPVFVGTSYSRAISWPEEFFRLAG